MAPQAVALQRRDIEHLLLAAGNARALEQLAATDDQTALIVVVLADTDQEHAPAVDLQAHPAVAERVDDPAVPPRRDALARRRRDVCKTQEGLAAEVGVQRSTVARWESGDTTPSLWARPRIANALDVTLDRLDELLVASQSEQAPLRPLVAQ
ncbi:helix-turn-helix transcriptional regulator [Kribbella sp. GL6]|uniref:helix-turn-helix transcriptional regulator n=1 Tax=Kribbella sp. GL6 TaxID=3419765 RepID=UPI003D063709